MVSHRTRKSPKKIISFGFADYAKVDRLVYYTFDAEHPSFRAALESGSAQLEAAYNALPSDLQINANGSREEDRLGALLNLGVDVAAAFPEILKDRPSAGLRFVDGDSDGNNGEQPSRPFVAGSLNQGAPSDEIFLEIPVVTDSNWKVLLHRAAEYARSLFTSSPLRKFALVFAHDHCHCQSRFLLFHRGGISASHAFDPRTVSGRRYILHAILALSTCRNWEDLGLPSWHDERHFRLPVDEHAESYVDASVEEVVCADDRFRGRATHVYRLSYPSIQPPSFPTPASPLDQASRHLGNVKFGPTVSFSRPLQPILGQGASINRIPAILKASWVQNNAEGLEMEVLNKCAGLFGCPRPHYSFLPIDDSETPTTNHLFLPTPEEAADEARLSALHWNDWMAETPSPPAPQLSSLFVHITSLVGSSLTLSPDPLSLMMAILHAMLGWLSMFQAGFLHRDISIGNILGLPQGFVMEESFVVDYSLLGEIQPIIVNTEHYDVEGQAARLKELIAKLGVGANAHAFVIDADMATRWPDSVGVRTPPPPVGTMEFMSPATLESLELNKHHLHSTVDDLFFFFYVAEWAAIFHPSGDDLAGVNFLRSLLSRNCRDAAMSQVHRLIPDYPDSDYGLFLSFLGPVFRQWFNEQQDSFISYRRACREAGDVEEKLRLLFFTAAYRGVADLMAIILKHRDSLASYQPTGDLAGV
ncbi:hypothetical protein FB45DRAFT_1055342 [Roridomyces roridus]|uniref:Fungal-type protein kinase domain-containing protein n=1 Tax=Roridomyces roridus TaxID=1738132 RepID=A0AAD7FRW1_9AGAR|nr:hypothetical protein FB45DRAFT_1055342 [Roridomyces roridus]